MKKILFLVIVLSFTVILCNTGFAATPQPPSNVPVVNTPSPTPDKGFDFLGISKIADGIGNMVNDIKSFFVDGVGGVIEKSLGDIFESFVNVTAIDGKWVFSTPTLVQSNWVRTLWWIMLFISIGSIGIGIGVTMLRIISGKYKGHLKTALLSFVASAVLVSFSLLIADKMIIFGNDLINSYARGTLSSEAQKPENQSAMLLKNIDYSKIGFEYFDGKSLVNLSFGSNPSESKMYEQFLTKNGGGGGIILVWAMTIIALIGIFGTLRQLVIGAINGLGPLWISITAWTGNMKPVYGYLNLHIRCIALSYVFDFTWMICVYFSNHSDFSYNKQLFASLMFTIALVAACSLFGYWVYQALKSPVDLAGGLVQEYGVKKLSRIYSSAGAIFDKLGAGRSEDDSTESSKKPSSKKNPSADKESPSEEKPQSEIKDRLNSAEQATVKNIPNEQPSGSQSADIIKNSGGQAAATNENTINDAGMKYDSTLGRPVKSSYDLHSGKNINNPSAVRDVLSKQDSLPVKSYDEHLSDYKSNSDLQKSYNKPASIPPLNRESAESESVKQESSLLNGGNILKSIDKNGGGSI